MPLALVVLVAVLGVRPGGSPHLVGLAGRAHPERRIRAELGQNPGSQLHEPLAAAVGVLQVPRADVNELRLAETAALALGFRTAGAREGCVTETRGRGKGGGPGRSLRL